jgi:flagellum-specific peptidoglycan hydrolase FlgJ
VGLVFLAAILLFGETVEKPALVPIQPMTHVKTKWERLFRKMETQQFEFPRVVVSQMILETGSYTSDIYQHNKNVFGMKKRRDTTYSTEIRAGHSAYKNAALSLAEYLKYQKMILRLARKKYKIETEDDYLWLLDHLPHCKGCRYAEDPLYTTKLRAIIARDLN